LGASPWALRPVALSRAGAEEAVFDEEGVIGGRRNA
jgi:hypothetical protein